MGTTTLSSESDCRSTSRARIIARLRIHEPFLVWTSPQRHVPRPMTPGGGPARPVAALDAERQRVLDASYAAKRYRFVRRLPAAARLAAKLKATRSILSVPARTDSCSRPPRATSARGEFSPSTVIGNTTNDMLGRRLSLLNRPEVRGPVVRAAGRRYGYRVRQVELQVRRPQGPLQRHAGPCMGAEAAGRCPADPGVRPRRNRERCQASRHTHRASRQPGARDDEDARRDPGMLAAPDNE